MSEDMELAVILVNYNNEKDTVACLDSLANQTMDDFLTIVVDNGSEPSSFETVRESHKFPVYIENDQNLGFTGGNNTGIEYALEKNVDWILLLNNDTELHQDFLANFIEEAADLPDDVGIAGPKIHSYTSRELWSVGGYISKWTGSTGSLHERTDHINEPRDVPVTAGAALLVKAEVFQEIGLLDDDFFIYYEETEFCTRARRNGWRVMYVPVEGIYHKETTEHSFSSFGEYYLVRNRFIYQQKTRPLHVRAAFYPYYLIRWILLQVGYLLLVERDLGAARASFKGGLDALLGTTGKGHPEQDVY